MQESVKAAKNKAVSKDYGPAALFGKEQAEAVQKYHAGFPGYHATDLKKLDHLAEYLGVDQVYVKDESSRFGLNAFKGLGGSYCIGKYIAEKAGITENELTFEKLKSDKVKAITKDLTFVTATDGNHGRGIAWTCHELGLKAVVYMPKGSAKERLENIRKLGATEQLNGVVPTHIFLQAGVGAMSGAITGFFADYYKEKKPVITIVEPNKADCIFHTASADDGKIHCVTGDMNTIMAGLACGEPCTIGWDMLHRYAEHYVSAPDYVAAKGMRVLGNPMGDDEKVISGESGAATLGFVAELMTNESLDYLRKQIGIGKDSRILCISTEGDTDQKDYRDIVWDGKYPSF